MPSVCLAVIALNEESNIGDCLESAMESGIAHAVVLDTGSTDDTVWTAYRAIRRLGMDGRVPVIDFQRQPLDFSMMRNECLKLARGFGTDYLFWIDADDRVHGRVPDQLVASAYAIPVAMGWTKFRRPHLVATSTKCEFAMPRHEALVLPDPPVPIDDLVVMVGEMRRTERRSYEEDAQVLINYLRIHPNHPRATFYIAQSYRDAGNVELAELWYGRRLNLLGWDEERYYSRLMLAGLNPDTYGKELHLRMAKELNPHRLEAYRWLAQVYLDREDLGRHIMEVRAGLVAARDSRSERGLFVDTGARAILEQFERNLHAQTDSDHSAGDALDSRNVQLSSTGLSTATH